MLAAEVDGMSREAPSPFGALLRQWRGLRGLSQLALAGEAATTTRHLSFLETGRASPSREMVLRLAEALDVPLRERNALLEAAGFASLYRESALDAAELGPIRRVIALLLEAAEPFPAVVVDHAYDIVLANGAMSRFFSHLLPPEELAALGRPNLMRATFHPAGLHRFVANWAEVAPVLLGRLVREAQRYPADDPLRRLVDEVVAYPGIVPEWRLPQLERSLPPVIAMHLKRGDLEARVFGAITTLGTPQDVTLQELRIETFLPADAATEELARKLAAHSS
jgi:transcriptional regulator with XRE-family HTH domain